LNYGGQAVIEGVMMRGSRVAAVALRRPDGKIVVETEPLDKRLYRGPISRTPFLRGLLSLWDALGLGMKALVTSADVAAGEEISLSGPISWVTVLVGAGMGVALFMLLPSFLVGLLHIPLAWLSSLLEALVRLGMVVGYMWIVGFLPDIRRVYAYHGAEHKTIHAYEAGAELTVEEVRRFTTAHTRCGTSFLLTLVVLAFLIFAPFSQLPLLWRIISRIVLLPVLAVVSYEFIRVAARLSDRPWMRAIVKPNLALQRLTTREPDDEMLEVAIAALKAVLQGEIAGDGAEGEADGPATDP
jgi:uncharacterized protein YqhQ